MGDLGEHKKQVPQWVLRSMGVATPGSGRRAGKLPEDFLKVAEGIILQQLEYGTEITVPAVVTLLQTCIDVWNEQVDALTKDVSEARTRQQKDLERHGEVTQCGYKHAQHALRNYDFQAAKISKPGKHLPMNDPVLVAVKEHVKAEVETGAVHPLLVGNFDQVWTTLYEPASRVVWKNAAKQGIVKDLNVEDGRWYTRRLVASQLCISLGLETAALQGWSTHG
ncbi:unnamed protein product [Symbiodinium sp. CCMP2592]|nr:unnamed protein product [Symbiodinium sp. CCMP2592]